MMAFVVSAVTAELIRWGHSFVWGLCQSPGPLQCLWLHLSPLSLSRVSPKDPHSPRNPWNYPPPLCVSEIRKNCPPPSSVFSLSEHAFLEGRLLFIPSGGLTVNLLHWGKFLGVGPISVGYSESDRHSGRLSIHLCICCVSIYLCIDPSICLFGRVVIQCHTPLPSSFSLSILSTIIGWASTSFHFQPQQTERLH